MLSVTNKHQEWVPVVPEGKRILIIGASGGIGRVVAKMLTKSKVIIGAHYATNVGPLEELKNEKPEIIIIKKRFCNASDCEDVIEEFYERAGGLDGVVILVGGIKNSSHFTELKPEEWESDIFLNLSVPFYLARASMNKMILDKNGGNIILTGTESALHGGSPIAFPYGISKAGTECMVKGLAKEGARYSILVNGIRPGFIVSGFHERWHRKSRKELEERKKLIPLKRGGTPEEVAALIIYLLSDWSRFITGQMYAITGGDWL